jgi:hypothetical protein
MLDKLDNDQKNRLWAHKIHVNESFYDRLNFFLVFESVLLGVVGILYSRSHPEMFVIRVITILGLSLTIVWGYIQARHKYILNELNALSKEVLVEYRITLERRARVKWPFSSMWLLAYAVPTLVAFVWVILLIFL